MTKIYIGDNLYIEPFSDGLWITDVSNLDVSTIVLSNEEALVLRDEIERRLDADQSREGEH